MTQIGSTCELGPMACLRTARPACQRTSNLAWERFAYSARFTDPAHTLFFLIQQRVPRTRPRLRPGWGNRFSHFGWYRGLPHSRHPLVSITMKQKKETEWGLVGTPYLEKIFIQRLTVPPHPWTHSVRWHWLELEFLKLLFIHGPLQAAGVVGWLSISYEDQCCLSCSIFFFLQELVLVAFCFVISL
jgi:hypothetical protein